MLRRLAAQKFKAAVRTNFERRSFARVITEVHSSTNGSERELRIIVARTLCKRKHLLYKKEIKKAIVEIEGLSYDLAMVFGGLSLEHEIAEGEDGDSSDGN